MGVEENTLVAEGLSSGRDSEDLGKMRPFVQDRKWTEVDGARNLDLGIKRQRNLRPLVLVSWAFDWGDTQTETPVKEGSIFRSEKINFSPSCFSISISLSEWERTRRHRQFRRFALPISSWHVASRDEPAIPYFRSVPLNFFSFWFIFDPNILRDGP